MCAADDDRAVERAVLTAGDELRPEEVDEELEKCEDCGGLRTAAERERGACAGCDALEDGEFAGGSEEEDTDGFDLQLD